MGVLRRSEVILRFGSLDIGEAVQGQLAHDLVLTLSLDSHLCIIEAFNHRDGDVEDNIGEEHGCADESEPEQEFVAL